MMLGAVLISRYRETNIEQSQFMLDLQKSNSQKGKRLPSAGASENGKIWVEGHLLEVTRL